MTTTGVQVRLFAAKVRRALGSHARLTAAAVLIMAAVVASLTTHGKGHKVIARTPRPRPIASTLWNSGVPPQVEAAADINAVTLGVKFYARSPGLITGLRFYKSIDNTGPFVGTLWTDSGRVLASVPFPRVSKSGWQEVRLPNPVHITADRLYVASYTAPHGRYSVATNALSPNSPHTRGKLVATQGVFTYGKGLPTRFFKNSQYYVDVRFASSGQPPRGSRPPDPTPPPVRTPLIKGKVFPLGVWLQDPVATADQFKALGVNTYVGLWNWPSDSQANPGWAQSAIDTAAAHGMSVFGGESPAAATQAKALKNPDELTGYLAGDEPDMSDTVTINSWTKSIADMKAVRDLPAYGNFGKGMGGFDWWHDKYSDAEDAAWCAPLDVASVDYYGTTDPYEPAQNKGTWTYGHAIDQLQKACGSKPTWGMVELTQPWNNTPDAATPASIKADTWNAIIHGADGITFFLHDFWCNDGCDSIFSSTWAANRQAWSEVNADIHKYDAALTSPDVTGTAAATSTGIPLALLTKQVNGTTYVFAQADGSATTPNGHTGTATVTVNGKTFTDTWTPYQVRVYTTP